MSDKQMLELAAKAAGFIGAVTEYPNGFVEMSLTNHFNPHGSNIWNPLTDDGDALRLAINLNIQHYLVWDGEKDEYSTAAAHCFPQVRHIEEYCGMNDGQDIYAATRRAITRAAAEIGKNQG